MPGKPFKEFIGDASDGGGFVGFAWAHRFYIEDEPSAVVGQPCPGVCALDAPLELGLGVGEVLGDGCGVSAGRYWGGAAGLMAHMRHDPDAGRFG